MIFLAYLKYSKQGGFIQCIWCHAQRKAILEFGIPPFKLNVSAASFFIVVIFAMHMF